MKLLVDFLPLLLFFGTFKYAESHREWAAALATSQLGFLVSGGAVGPQEAPVLLATVVVMAATLTQVAVMAALRKRIEPMLWVSLALVVVLGAATVYFNSPIFVKWKPTLLYWAMAISLLAARLIWKRNLLRSLLGRELQLPDAVWTGLNTAWSLFFLFMGLLNLWVAYRFDDSTWATFKVFGGTGLLLVFALAQGVVVARHLPDEDAPAATPGEKS